MRHVKAGLSHRGTRETSNPLNMHIQYLLTPAPTTQREWFQGFRVSFSTLCGWTLMQQAPWPPVPRNLDAVQPRPVLMQPQPGQQSTHSNRKCSTVGFAPWMSFEAQERITWT